MEYFDITHTPVENKDEIELLHNTKVIVRYPQVRAIFKQDDDLIVLSIQEILDLADYLRSQIQAK